MVDGTPRYLYSLLIPISLYEIPICPYKMPRDYKIPIFVPIRFVFVPIKSLLVPYNYKILVKSISFSIKSSFRGSSCTTMGHKHFTHWKIWRLPAKNIGKPWATDIGLRIFRLLFAPEKLGFSGCLAVFGLRVPIEHDFGAIQLLHQVSKNWSWANQLNQGTI